MRFMHFTNNLPPATLQSIAAVTIVLLSTGTALAQVERPQPGTNPQTVPEQSTPALDGSPEKPEEPTTGATGEEYVQLLIEADRLHEAGRLAEAEHLYRKAKGSFTGIEFNDRPAPIYDPALLPPAGQVYWREATTGQELDLPTRVLVPLQLLNEAHPEFVPGTIRYVEVLLAQGRPEQALAVLERATSLYPEQTDLVQFQIQTLAAQEQWLDASLAARQFALLHPEDPASPEFAVLAEEYLARFKRQLRGRLTGNAIANVVTGALSYALTGGLFGPLSAIDTTVLLLQGEAEVGAGVAQSAQQELDLIEDPEVVEYVNEIGQRLARVAGREEFEYEFFVVRDPELNAFALPGGKVFINAGAITQAKSEAELAGLLAHELAHAVLSHGFQLATTSNVTATVLLPVPYAGSLATDLTLFSYSRDMERQADVLGTQMLTAAGYAADGLYNLMGTLDQENPSFAEFEWLSTHPDTAERRRNLEILIEQNGYNRYTYEGIERHQAIQERVNRLLADEADTNQKLE